MPRCAIVFACKVEGSKVDACLVVDACHGILWRVASGVELIGEVEFDMDGV